MSILSCDKYFILSLARCEGSPFSCEKHLPYEMRKGSKWIPSPVRSIPKDTLIIHLIGQILTPHTLDEKDRRVSAIKEPQESELSPSKFFPIVRKGTRNTTMTIQSIRFKMKTETLIVRGI